MDGEFEATIAFHEALSRIALGRIDSGRPLASEIARQLARTVLTQHGWDWRKPPYDDVSGEYPDRTTGQEESENNLGDRTLPTCSSFSA